jgi:hypothetical protein
MDCVICKRRLTKAERESWVPGYPFPKCQQCVVIENLQSDLASLRAQLAAAEAECERLKLQQYTTDDAHEIWALAQLLPGEGIEDGVKRIIDFFKRTALVAEKAISPSITMMRKGLEDF